MNVLRSTSLLLACLPLLSTSCVLDRSATADCSEGVPCRLQELGEGPFDDGSVDPESESDAGNATSADAATLNPFLADAGAGEPLPGPDPGRLPKVTGSCPEFSEGSATFKGSNVRLWVGSDGESKRGPLVFYWYSNEGDASEVMHALGAGVIAEIKQLGGMVAALEKSTREGVSTGTTSWSTGDYAVADEVVACAIAKGVGIDSARIHAVGFGAGGLHSSWMAYARSSYLASVVAYSGGLTSSWRTSSVTEDANNVVPAMLVHGKLGADRYLYDFSLTSSAMVSDIAERGGFALDCEHSLGHNIPDGVGGSALRFLLDHPYKQSPSPYRTAIPSSFPSYCKVP